MASSRAKTEFWRGVRVGAPFVLAITPFAIVFGVLGNDSGLTTSQTMAFSVIVIAGAAQFAAVQLMNDGAPFIAVVLTALAVNLRMAMYSASLVPHLGSLPLWQRAILSYFLVDQNFSLSLIRFEDEPDIPQRDRLAYFIGLTMPVVPLWYLGTYFGIVAGRGIPPEVSLDIFVPVAFLAMVAIMLRSWAHAAAAVTSFVLALLLRDLPFRSGLLVAGMVAMVVGAVFETIREARA